jgi:hypothetical protein
MFLQPVAILQPERKENTMATKTIVTPRSYPGAHVPLLARIARRLSNPNQATSRFNLLDFLFQNRAEGAYNENLSPHVVYTQLGSGMLPMIVNTRRPGQDR